MCSNQNYNLDNFLDEHKIVRPSKPKHKTTETSDEFQIRLNDYNEKNKEYEQIMTKHTHTWYGPPYNTAYKIEDFELDTLFHLYDKGIQDGMSVHLTERHNDLDKSSMIIDVDEKYNLNIKSRIHTKKHIEDLVRAYQEEICKCFEIESDDERLTAYVFEKPNIVLPENNDGNVKDGIHIIFPEIISEQGEQKYIRKNILKKVPDIYASILSSITNKPAQMIDESVIHDNPWFLFASKKKNCDAYELSYVIDYNGDFIFDHTNINETQDLNYLVWKNESPAKYLSIRLSSKKKALITRKEILPSIIKNTNIIKIKKKAKAIDFDLIELSEIMDLLSEKRASDYQSWIQIGWALYNIDPFNERLLDLWIKFSKKDENYINSAENTCNEHWAKKFKIKENGLGIGSLYHFAKCDSPEQYYEIKRRSLKVFIDKSIESKTDFDLAKVLHEMYKHEFVCASTKKGGQWYHFINHRWNVMEADTEIYEKISVNMCDEYCRRLSDCNSESIDEDSTEEEREAAEKKGQKMMDIIRKLKTNSNKKSIMDECKRLFYNKQFKDKLDMNPYLIGFENGIYDLEKHQFRDGVPEDYVSMTTNIDYINFDETNENWIELKLFLESIFPNNEMYEYFFTFMSSCLQGINKEEKFRIWIGSGSNGKSKLEELFLNAFGEYCMKFPITMLTGKRPQAGSADPNVANAKGKRFCYFEEPNEGEKVNSGRLKEYTGGDKVEGRGLYQEKSAEYKPQFKLALLCNFLPSVPATDTGFWRRIEVIEFKSKFVEHPIEDFEFKIDSTISEKIPNWKELFMGYLIDVFYKKYSTNGIKVPDEVKKYTMEYQKQCDMYSDFIIEVIEESNSVDSTINIGELHEEFKTWYVENFNDNKSIPSKRDFKKYLEKKYGKNKVSTNEILYCKYKSTYSKSATEGIHLNKLLTDLK
jgi:P4 family phage/plasmid primase-like protien